MTKFEVKELAYNVIFDGKEETFEGFVEAIRYVYHETGCLSDFVVYENDDDFFQENFKDNVFDVVRELCDHDCQYDIYSQYVKLDDYYNLISYEISDLKEEYAQCFNVIFERIANCPECYYLLDSYIVELIEEYNSIN